MIKINEIIVVEGKYDQNKLKQIVDAVVLTTNGFGIFKDNEKLKLIRKLTEEKGIIILTDSDGAGLVIRNFLKGALPKTNIKFAYIPQIKGKEKRKSVVSKEGFLGVEGVSNEEIILALEKSGATINNIAYAKKELITKSDLMLLGLSGNPNSSILRKKVLTYFKLPDNLSANAMLEMLNIFSDLDEIKNIIENINSGGNNEARTTKR